MKSSAKRAHAAGETNVISAAFPYQKQRRRVLGREMAYVEVGEGDPIVIWILGGTFRMGSDKHYPEESAGPSRHRRWFLD